MASSPRRTYFDRLHVDILNVLLECLDEDTALNLCEVSRRIKEMVCKNSAYFLWKYKQEFPGEELPEMIGDVEFEAFENYMDRRQIRKILAAPGHSVEQKMLDLAAFNDGMYFYRFGLPLAFSVAEGYGINEVQDENISRYFEAIVPLLEDVDDRIFDALSDLRAQYGISFVLPDDVVSSAAYDDEEGRTSLLALLGRR